MGSTIVNGDSSVNIFDLVVVVDNFGKSNIAPPTIIDWHPMAKIVFKLKAKIQPSL